MQDAASLYEFVRIGELAETTTQLLSLTLQHNTLLGGQSRSRQSSIGRIEQLVLQQARDYVASVREGFVFSVRTTQVTNASELRFLLDRVLVDWTALSQELALDAASGAQQEQGAVQAGDEQSDTATQPRLALELERLRHQLLAFGMAAAALGQLPRMPSERITFPFSYSTPPTYADISAPATPAAMLQRIEEMETTIWQLMSADVQELVNRRYGSLRRTYGFFESSALLARRDWEQFGFKRVGSNFANWV